jgi:hypothetical protein
VLQKHNIERPRDPFQEQRIARVVYKSIVRAYW